MKSTYKLVGLFWDGKPEGKEPDTVYSYDADYLPAAGQPCLFDLIEMKRRIELSELFAANGQVGFEAIVKKLAGCSSLAVVIDCPPKTRGLTQRRFFRHRTLQVFGSLARALPGTKVAAMVPDGMGLEI